MATIFAPPIITRRRSTSNVTTQADGTRKRKRRRTTITTTSAPEGHETAGRDGQESVDDDTYSIEYSTVISPVERRQRRVAGQPLDKPVPTFPFPHAKPSQAVERESREALSRSATAAARRPRDNLKPLHGQHISALTAVVHRSLLTRDYARAARALGLLFREDAGARSAHLRSQGFWGIGAEVLLHEGTAKHPSPVEAEQAVGAPNLAPERSLPGLSFSRMGFERAQRYYEKLIIRHPYHKSWPESVNSIDFYLAMFNLWIYVVQENSHLSASHNGGSQDGLEDLLSPWEASAGLQAKMKELEQAGEIAARMDACMASVPYSDDLEMVRLRAMVALWVADLNDQCLFYLEHGQPPPLDEIIASHVNGLSLGGPSLGGSSLGGPLLGGSSLSGPLLGDSSLSGPSLSNPSLSDLSFAHDRQGTANLYARDSATARDMARRLLERLEGREHPAAEWNDSD